MTLESKKKRVSFFLNPWASAEIRGRQIGQKLEERGYEVNFDDKKIEEDDVKIFVKCVPSGNSKNVWIDVVDCIGVVPVLSNRPELGVISISRIGTNVLKNSLPSHRIVFLPEHHCNWEGEWRKREKKVEVVGYCGYKEGFLLSPEVFEKQLGLLGMKFLYKTEFSTRKDIVDFYRNIDIQVAFRPDAMTYPEFRNPLKLENAGSFGIPTVCFPELTSWEEWSGCFISVASVDEMIWQCKLLRGIPDYYSYFGDRAFERSKLYSIERIVDRYVELIENGRVDTEFFTRI